MKKSQLVVMIACLLLLSWCGKKYTQTIVVDTYQIPLITTEPYTKTISSKSEILQQYQGENLWSGAFISSLFIAKKTNPGFSGDDLGKQIINNEIRSIAKSEIKNQKDITLSCRKKENISIANIEISTSKDPLYLTQEIIIQTGDVYIISHMTKNKKEKNAITDSLHNIICIK